MHNVSWVAGWVRELLEDVPEILALCERKESSGSFAYDYGVVLKFQDGTVRHRWFTACAFNYANIKEAVRNALSMNFPPPVWIAEAPPSCIVKNVINLQSLLEEGSTPESASKPEAVWVEEVLRAELHWILPILDAFPQIVAIGKARKDVSIGNTYLFERKRKDGAVEFTWMKDPRVEEVAANLPDPTCVDCGCSLKTNKNFSLAQRCGECQLELAGSFAWMDEKIGPKAFPEIKPKARRDDRFDPRPGIDDRGAWASPSWEEDYS